MNPTFNSKKERPWLIENHKRRSDRAIRIGKETIDLLISKGIPITFSNISLESKAIDMEGKGIHSNTIRSNEELYKYYKLHSKTFKQRESSKRNKSHNNLEREIDFKKLKHNRNLDNQHRKYMKLSKRELIQRLLLAEQYISDNENKWVSAHFDSFQ